jgi:hypothetical protein
MRIIFISALLLSVMVENSWAYTTEELFSTSTENGGGFTRTDFTFEVSELSFTTLVPDAMKVWIGKNPEEGDVVARVYDPAQRDNFLIEVHRVDFPSFAQAISAGHGYLSRLGYDRIIRDEAKSNHAFALLSAVKQEPSGEYGQMARAAVVSRGTTVLIAIATLRYDNYRAYEPVIARFFGGLRMALDIALDKQLKSVTGAQGTRFLVPAEWSVAETGKASEAGAADYAMTLSENEYPNISCQVRPGTIESGREFAVQMSEAFTASIKARPEARLDGAPERKTYNRPHGAVVGYSFAQQWTLTKYALPMIAQFNVQINESKTLGLCGLNAFDGQRNTGHDDESTDIIYRNWVVGISAFAIARLSLQDGTDAVLNDLDIRQLGH